MDSQSTEGQNQKLLAFFGSDMKERGAGLLREAFSKGYTLLALDASAVGIAAEAKITYTLIDDWVDSSTMLQAREKATRCEQEWFQSARDKFTSEKVCWPEFDHHAMHWFWADAMLAMALAEAFRFHGVQEVRFFQNPSRRPMVYYFPSDTHSSVWEAKLPGVAKPYELPQITPPMLEKPFLYRVLRYTRSRVGKVVRVIRRGSITAIPTVTSNTNTLRGKVVLAFNPGEFYRFAPIIQQLRENLPQKIAAVILSPNRTTAAKIAAEWSIPVVCGPSCVPVDSDPRQQFLGGYAQALDAAVGEPWQKPLDCLQFHFEYYCKERWPRLASSFQAWSELWRQTRPKAVVISSLQDSESQLPAEAAKRFDITTFSIPHGAGATRNWDQVVSDYVLYSFSTQKVVFERSGIPPQRLIGCRDLVAESEYPVIPISMNTTRKTWRLLALMDPIGLAGCLAPTTSPTAQLSALRTLDNPPTDIAERLFLSIKVHPKYSDLELFAAAGGRLPERVLSPDSELKSVLRETDVIVAVNYCGSALVHVLRAGKAVIFFWTDPLIGKTEPHTHADLYLSAGVLVRTQEDLWSLVRDFFTNTEVAEQMRLKAQDFCRKNLDDSKYPSIGEVVDRILSGQKGPFDPR